VSVEVHRTLWANGVHRCVLVISHRRGRYLYVTVFAGTAEIAAVPITDEQDAEGVAERLKPLYIPAVGSA
jgi:hypothetical protein